MAEPAKAPARSRSSGAFHILRNWIIASTYLGLFSAIATFYIGSVHLLYFYPVMVFNLLLLTLRRSLWFPPGLLFLLGFMFLSGAVGIAQGTDTAALFLKSAVGIALSAIYYCAFLRFMRFDAEVCFARYAQTAYFLALLGLFLLPFQSALAHQLVRLKSVEYEPGEFTIVCLPALYFYADQWHRHHRGGRQLLVLLLAIALAGSSIGFMGLFVGLYLFGTRFRFGAVFAPVLIVVLGVGVYTASSDFRLRLDDSIAGFRLLDASSINASSLSLLSGAFVAAEALLHHPLLGEGLGSISLANGRYVTGLRGTEQLPPELLNIAGGDGGSMFYRLIGETGLIGFGLAIGFLWYCFPRGASTQRKQIATAILVYSFVKFLRSGVYFNPDVLFLVLVYAVNGSHVFRRAANRVLTQSTLPALSETALPTLNPGQSSLP